MIRWIELFHESTHILDKDMGVREPSKTRVLQIVEEDRFACKEKHYIVRVYYDWADM